MVIVVVKLRVGCLCPLNRPLIKYTIQNSKKTLNCKLSTIFAKMLQKLHIRNYAIIEELDVVFHNGLTVITGETGAGKSIILGALSLILGDRADTSVLTDKEQKCIVEAHFDTSKNNAFKSIIEREDIDWEQPTIIRREINKSGKSRAFVNDTPVNLGILNELSSTLVDLHRQFDIQDLKDEEFMFSVVDALAEQQNTVTDFQQKLKLYKSKRNDYIKLSETQTQWQKEADYKQFLFDELEEANINPEEITNAENDIKLLNNAEHIQQTLQSANFAINDSEQSLILETKKQIQLLHSIANVLPDAAQLAERLNSNWLELKDIADEIENLLHQSEINPEKIQILQDRLDLAYKLMKKHNVADAVSLHEIRETLAKELELKNNTDEQLEILKKETEQMQLHLEEIATSLHQNRIKSIPQIEQKINANLHLVGMPNATFKIELQAVQQFNNFGKHRIDYLIDTNGSKLFTPISKTASGGEMSRLMLSIKTETAQALSLPTLIFDEVDTGISGEAARQVGNLLHSLGKYHQVICITHLPQVAAKGNHHYFVYKHNNKNTHSVYTSIKQLNKEERINTIAQMIAGENITDIALKNAKELIEQ